MSKANIKRRTFIAGCTVGAASVMVGTASAAAEQVEVTVTGRGGQVTKIEDFSAPDPYDSFGTEVDGTTLTTPGGGEPTIDGTGSSTQPAGSGTSSDPYQVTTVNELAYMDTDPVSIYELQNDLIFPDPGETGLYGSDGWSPVGGFDGTLDGQGHRMTNFYIDRGGTAGDQGLFSDLSTGGVAKNFLISGDVTGDSRTALIVGLSQGTVENVSVHGSVSGGRPSGSVVGRNEGTVSNVYSDADVTLSDSDQGGIVGNNGGTVEKSIYTGSMGSSPTSYQGPIVGRQDGTLTDAYYNSDNVGLTGPGTGLTTSEMQGTAAETNMNLDFTNTWRTTVASDENVSSDSYPTLREVDRDSQLKQLGVLVRYWIDKYTVDRSRGYRISVPESISSELRVSDTPPDGSETTVSPGEEVTISTNSFYIRWDLAPGETIESYSVEIDERTAIDTVTIAGQSNTINRVLDSGEEVTFTTSVALGTGYDIDITPISTGDNTAVDVELRGTKIREASGAIVLEDGSPQPRGSLYYAPNGESILWIPEVDANNWKFELIEETTNVTVDDLDLSGYVTEEELNLSEYVKKSDLNQDPDVSAEDVEGLDEYIERKGTPQDGGGIPPSDSGPIEQITGFFRDIGRSISEQIRSLRRRL